MLTVLADRGYLNPEQILACEGTGVLPCVPKTLTSGHAKRGLFTGQDLVYDAEQDHYEPHRVSRRRFGLDYAAKACASVWA